ncbi:MAG: hypothetical protein EA417_07015 [Gammaproteobacteria bacterium]|nr:MAG: hypothetical protein EA417_07015 [Gammaproteobacteria bacterium]
MLRMDGFSHDILIWGIGIVALAGADLVHGDSGREATVDDLPVAFSVPRPPPWQNSPIRMFVWKKSFAAWAS